MRKYLSILIAISFLIYSPQIFADCAKNVQKIEKGVASPCTGWLVSEPQMQKMAKTDEELELTKKLVQSQSHLIKLSEAEIDFYKRKSTANEKALSQSETKRFWATAGAFALGVLVTGVAAKAAIESTR